MLLSSRWRPLQRKCARAGTCCGFRSAPSGHYGERREDPLDYNMIRIMPDESAPAERRDEMAKAAAPYVHPKLAAIEHEVEWLKRPLPAERRERSN